jgi:hypothetical protein
MPRNQTKVFTVTGRGPFPIDMLRYDGAYPYSTQDARDIETSFDLSDGYRPWKVQLYTNQWNSPTNARWDSFNCRVLEEARY